MMSQAIFARARYKRKRPDPLRSIYYEAEDIVKDTDDEGSENNGEPSSLQIAKRAEKSRPHGKAFEDGIGMEFSPVPKKPRSVAKRLQQLPADPSSQASLAKSLSGIRSPDIVVRPGRKMASAGIKLPSLKLYQGVMTEQETEVAEVLFNLAKCIPSEMAVVEPAVENRVDPALKTGMEVGPSTTVSPFDIQNVLSPNSSSSTDENSPSQIHDTTAQTAVEAPNGKLPQVAIRSYESRTTEHGQIALRNEDMQHSTCPGVLLKITQQAGCGVPVFVTEMHQEAQDELAAETELFDDKNVNTSLSPKWHAVDESKANAIESDANGNVEARGLPEMRILHGCPTSSAVIADTGTIIQHYNDASNNRLVQSSSADDYHSTSESRIDQMINFPSSTNIQKGNSFQKKGEQQQEREEISREKQIDSDNATSEDMEQNQKGAPETLRECSKHDESGEKSEQLYQERPIKVPETDTGPPKPHRPDSSIVYPYLAPTFPTPSFMVQLPSISHPLPEFKHCATHVYIARFISMNQQLTQHPFWTNRRKMPAYFDMLSKMSLPQQAGVAYGFLVNQSSASGTTVYGANNITVGGKSMNGNFMSEGSGISADGTDRGIVMDAASNSPYAQAIMQKNGFPSFSLPAVLGSLFNGLSGQAIQNFNNPFYPPAQLVHSPLHVQPVAQQAASPIHPQMQQQRLKTPSHDSSSQPLPLPLSPLLQQQSQPSIQERSDFQQRYHEGIQNSSYHSESKNKMSVAEDRTSMLQSTHDRGSASLSSPDLRNPSSIHGITMPLLPLNPDGFTLRGSTGRISVSKHMWPQLKMHLQSPEQSVASASVQQQQTKVHYPVTDSGYQVNLEVQDLSVSQTVFEMPVVNLSEDSVASGTLGLTPVGADMTSQGNAMHQGVLDLEKCNTQVLQGTMGQHRHEQRQEGMQRLATSIDENGWIATGAVLFESVEAQKTVISEPETNVTLQSLEPDPSQGSLAGVIGVQLSTNGGRTLNLIADTGNQSSRSGGLISTVSIPVSAHLPNDESEQVVTYAKAVVNSGMLASAGNLVIHPLDDQSPSSLAVNIPIPGQGVPASQGEKLGQAIQSKLEQRVAAGMIVPTAPGASPQAVLTAAIAKKQGQSIQSHKLIPNTSTPKISSHRHAPLSSIMRCSSTVHNPLGNSVPKHATNGKVSSAVSAKWSLSADTETISSYNTSVKSFGHEKAQFPYTVKQQLETESQLYQQEHGNHSLQACPPQGQFGSQLFVQQPTEQCFLYSQQHRQDLPWLQHQPIYQFEEVVNPSNQHAHVHWYHSYENRHLHIPEHVQSASSLPSASLAELSLGSPSLTLRRGSLKNGQGNLNSERGEHSHGIASISCPSKPTRSPEHQLSSLNSAASNHVQLISALGANPVQKKSVHSDLTNCRV